MCIAAYASAGSNTWLFNMTVTVNAETLTYGNYEYTLLNNGTVEITKYVGSAAKLTIPPTIGGKADTSKADSSSKAAAAATTSNPATGAAAAVMVSKKNKS